MVHSHQIRFYKLRRKSIDVKPLVQIEGKLKRSIASRAGESADRSCNEKEGAEELRCLYSARFEKFDIN